MNMAEANKLVERERERQARRFKTSICILAGAAVAGIITAVLTTANIVQSTEVIREVPVEVIREVQVPVEKTVVEQQTVYVPVATDNAFILTDDERELVTRVVIAEAGAATLQDMVGVAQVIRDRAEHERTDLYRGPDVTSVLSRGHAKPYSGDISVFPLAAKAVEIVFDAGIRLFDETTCIYFTPDKSDPDEMALLRQYTYVGETPYFEFHSDKLEVSDNEQY